MNRKRWIDIDPIRFIICDHIWSIQFH